MVVSWYFIMCVVLAYYWRGEAVVKSMYKWKERDNYYYHTIDKKIESIAHLQECVDMIKKQSDNTIKIPISQDEAYISSFPVSKDLFRWWANIPKPQQMRVDPYICDVVYTKRLPIFNNTGCQLPGYMSPSAPRCQTQYLRWICEQARLPINSTTANHFILPEADHQSNMGAPPPQPWLLTARNAVVSMCGQVSLPCGEHHCYCRLYVIYSS